MSGNNLFEGKKKYGTFGKVDFTTIGESLFLPFLRKVKFHQHVPIGATVVKSGETMHIQALGGDTNQGIFFDLRQLHSKDLIPRFFKFCSFSQTSPLLLLTYSGPSVRIIGTV